MTLYAPTDFVSITIPTDRGGCGQPHEAGETNEFGHAVINCDQCEPAILATRHGFGTSPTGVHLTTDEIAEAAASEAQAARARNRTWGDPQALGDALAKALTKAVPAPAPTLSPAELVAGMSEEDKAALRALLGDTPADSTSGDPTPQAKRAAKKAAPAAGE